MFEIFKAMFRGLNEQGESKKTLTYRDIQKLAEEKIKFQKEQLTRVHGTELRK